MKFAKGEPTKVEDAATDPIWLYQEREVTYAVYFKQDKVTRVGAWSESASFLPPISGPRIFGYESVDTITKTLGPPAYVSYSKDGLQRLYSFPKFNVAFGLAQGKMFMELVGVTEESPVRFAEEASP